MKTDSLVFSLRSSRSAVAGLMLTAGLAAAGAGQVAADDDERRDSSRRGRSTPHHHQPERFFQRVATFPVFLNTDVESETVAEIVTSTPNGKTLVYTDSQTENIGFVDIADPADPIADGIVAVGGEPTSVAVTKRYALAAVNTSVDYVNPSGLLQVIDVRTRTIVATLDLGGQPDAVSVSPDGKYAAIAIENERDEDLGDGRPPQAPPGFVVIVDLKGPPRKWTTRTVDLVGIPDQFPDDPEPEFVDINRKNQAVVTLQENNHIVIIDLKRGRIVDDFSAGTVDHLDQIDTLENDLIEPNASLSDVPREPDGVVWIDDDVFATADEGDLDGGSRGFTLFLENGVDLYNAGNTIEHMVTRLGHYPESRSENKGNEPENVEFGRYSGRDLLFVGSERSSVVLVYDLRGGLKQVLPTGVAPEGLHAIPQRGLFVAAAEDDSRGDKFRSSISIYRLGKDAPTYPTIVSENRNDGSPIPWGALSALAADPTDASQLFTAHDSYYTNSRLFRVDLSQTLPTITDEIVLTLDGSPVDLDLEGLAVREGGGFWVASEGAGTVGDPGNPFATPNLLLKVAADGTILDTITLPLETTSKQVRFGLEGVTTTGSAIDGDELVYVAFQREWAGDPDDRVRIGQYDPATDSWAFFYYPIDLPTSPLGGWVGLSEIVSLDDETFAVVERDNQAGSDARIKRIYQFSIRGLQPLPEADAPAFPVVHKRLVRDLIPDLLAPGGAIIEKVEGLTVLPTGNALIVTDNDGVEDSNGETQLINLGPIFTD
ncbi:hypothetical protein Enr13x_65200 [Stieleria neptunia]|uniref:Phytase-like domain-containing protein n=1 Tax=Stieleria neptunia TaxID=2527979 RepID=A0A518I0H5_9BACT|nr:esterase-like activity of phytase family protein [Stieleria neptunia]QDV46611.1 hypothetical protein Enr13x_65200 [Stieleria neptunia]